MSLASAKAAFDRLLDRGATPASPLTPERFLELDDATLKTAGFSRQKTRYGRELAAAVLSGSLDLAGLHALDDDAVTAALTQVVGIGRWTADIYLLMALCRPDAWPAGDLALAIAARHAFGLAATPGTRRTGGHRRSLAPLARRRRPGALALLPERWYKAEMKRTLPARPPFSFRSVADSHGWRQLVPFAGDADGLSNHRPAQHGPCHRAASRPPRPTAWRLNAQTR